jgi:sec-independent protein translocase protein TatC
VAFSLRRGRKAGDDEVPDEGVPDDGTMTLVEHLRELRSRIVRSVVAIILATIVSFFFYNQIFELLTRPFTTTVNQLAKDEGLQAQLTLTGVADAFTLQLKTSLAAGIVISSPYWLYQIWAFIVPGLHPRERRWTRVFAAIAGPLFLLGVAIGYYVLPKGLSILLDFTPADVSNLIEVSRYLSFILRMLLVFGIAFEIPLFVVLLNLAGVVTGRQLGRFRAWIILGTFIFAAVATPSTDPISMLFLAIPMTLLFLLSEIIARLIDRRRGIHDYEEWDDNEQSDLTLDRGADDDMPSSLDESDD